MKQARSSSFDEFAHRFVRAYWQTLKAQTFSMPPNEPLTETLEELLAAVSIRFPSDQPDTIVMTSNKGDWWEFAFRLSGGTRTISSAKAKSLSPAHPHDLLSPPLDQYLRPFLEYVTRSANNYANEH